MEREENPGVIADEHGSPTPEEIAQRAAEIRKEWSPTTYRRRAGLEEKFVEVLRVKHPSLDPD